MIGIVTLPLGAIDEKCIDNYHPEKQRVGNGDKKCPRTGSGKHK
ncbi:MAG: hypothetical protein WC620_06575 [Methanoregula sp.]